jgi:hypothetical protein
MKHQASPQVGISGIYAGEDVKLTTGDGAIAQKDAPVGVDIKPAWE